MRAVIESSRAVLLAGFWSIAIAISHVLGGVGFLLEAGPGLTGQGGNAAAGVVRASIWLFCAANVVGLAVVYTAVLDCRARRLKDKVAGDTLRGLREEEWFMAVALVYVVGVVISTLRTSSATGDIVSAIGICGWASVMLVGMLPFPYRYRPAGALPGPGSASLRAWAGVAVLAIGVGWGTNDWNVRLLTVASLAMTAAAFAVLAILPAMSAGGVARRWAPAQLAAVAMWALAASYAGLAVANGTTAFDRMQLDVRLAFALPVFVGAAGWVLASVAALRQLAYLRSG